MAKHGWKMLTASDLWKYQTYIYPEMMWIRVLSQTAAAWLRHDSPRPSLFVRKLIQQIQLLGGFCFDYFGSSNKQINFDLIWKNQRHTLLFCFDFMQLISWHMLKLIGPSKK
jgi:hypothetical protein